MLRQMISRRRMKRRRMYSIWQFHFVEQRLLLLCRAVCGCGAVGLFTRMASVKPMISSKIVRWQLLLLTTLFVWKDQKELDPRCSHCHYNNPIGATWTHCVNVVLVSFSKQVQGGQGSKAGWQVKQGFFHLTGARGLFRHLSEFCLQAQNI